VNGSQPGSAYRDVQIRTANQIRLIVMLYDGAIRHLNLALDAIAAGHRRYDEVNNHIIGAQEILSELTASIAAGTSGISSPLYGASLEALKASLRGQKPGWPASMDGPPPREKPAAAGGGQRCPTPIVREAAPRTSAGDVGATGNVATSDGGYPWKHRKIAILAGCGDAPPARRFQLGSWSRKTRSPAEPHPRVESC
jgi:flagellar protein FliS